MEKFNFNIATEYLKSKGFEGEDCDEMIEIALKTLRQQIPKVTETLSKGDKDSFADHIHKLSSILRLFNLRDLLTKTGDIELKIRKESTWDKNDCESLLSAYKRLKIILEEK